LDLLLHRSWLISALDIGFAFGIRLRISSTLFSASDSRLSQHPNRARSIMWSLKLITSGVGDHPTQTKKISSYRLMNVSATMADSAKPKK
jgi:hypothetical protein